MHASWLGFVGVIIVGILVMLRRRGWMIRTTLAVSITIMDLILVIRLVVMVGVR